MPVVIAILGIIALFVGLAGLFAIPVWLLWNWLMPLIFGLSTLTFLQAFGLNLLAGFLFRAHINTSKS